MSKASDLPDRHRSPNAMARCLVSYMPDNRAVMREVKDAFGRSPDLLRISDMRARQNRKPRKEKIVLGEGPYPQTLDQLEAASKLFVHRLEMERARSVALAQSLGALKSPLLTSPQLVDKAYEAEIGIALGRNTER